MLPSALAIAMRRGRSTAIVTNAARQNDGVGVGGDVAFGDRLGQGRSSSDPGCRRETQAADLCAWL